jgi:hypothetical protein
VWSTSGKPIPELRHAGPVRSAAFSPDGSQVITACSDGTALVWDAKTGAEIPYLANLNGSVAPFASLDDLSVLILDDGRGYVRHIGKQLSVPLEGCTFEEPGISGSMTFSPDGSRVVAVRPHGTVGIWDAQSGALLLTLKAAPTGDVNSAAFSPDGSQIVTGGEHGTARVWYADGVKEWTASEVRLISWRDGFEVGSRGNKYGVVTVGTDSDTLLHIEAFPHLDRGSHFVDAFETRDSSGALHLKLRRVGEGSHNALEKDALESGLPTAQSGAITALKQRLPGLMPPHVLSDAERRQVLSAVTFIIGHSP